jgi:hypothetical protein
MGLDVDWELDLLTEPPPTFKNGEAIFQPTGPNVRLQIEMRDADLARDIEDGL